ncbi:hypothetical protein [Afipia felis]|nr:hypothetical protein [Afipia felis]
MSLRSALWGLPEIEPETPKPKPKRKQYGNIERRVYVSTSTDIEGWWKTNRPETLAGCANLRLALKTYRTVQDYSASYRYGRFEQRLVRLTGPNGSVMITSRKARAYFNNKIRNLEVYLETLASQFGYDVTFKRNV